MTKYIVLPICFDNLQTHIFKVEDPQWAGEGIPLFDDKTDALDHQVALMDDDKPTDGTWEIFEIHLLTDKDFEDNVDDL